MVEGFAAEVAGFGESFGFLFGVSMGGENLDRKFVNKKIEKDLKKYEKITLETKNNRDQ